jgi:hypothetical protein
MEDNPHGQPECTALSADELQDYTWEAAPGSTFVILLHDFRLPTVQGQINTILRIKAETFCFQQLALQEGSLRRIAWADGAAVVDHTVPWDVATRGQRT